MRPLLICWLTLSCCSTVENDVEEEPTQESPQEDPSTSQDAEVCRNARNDGVSMCPLGFGFRWSDNPNDDYTFTDISDIGEPLCNGNGTYLPRGTLDPTEIEHVGVQITRNSVCSFGCFPACSWSDVCIANEPLEQASCVQTCTTGTTEETCRSFLAECLSSDNACSD